MIFWKGAIRSLPSPDLFLTFDDGPQPTDTEKILDVLDKHGAKATFFVVTEKARTHKSILRQVLLRGHAIGNHSLDHRYSAFFKSRATMLNWVQQSEDILRQMLGHPTVGFRPPAGVCTPKLHWALGQMRMPLYLWNKRFFDTRFDWTPARALGSLESTTPGSIVLLHESHRNQTRFLETLDLYLKASEGRAFKTLPSRQLESRSSSTRNDQFNYL